MSYNEDETKSKNVTCCPSQAFKKYPQCATIQLKGSL